MAEQASESTKFYSKLKTGRERFLAHVIEHGLEIEQRSAADFIRHFPPAIIMMGLANQAELRAQMLVLTTGVRHKIAVRKSAESSGEDLQIALDEGETDPESVVAIFDPDDRIRYLDHERLWAFCVEGSFWNASPTNPVEIDRARRQVAFVIERALVDALITHHDVVEAIGVAELATRLPRAELGKLIEKALEAGHRKAPFTDTDLLATLPPSEIVRHVPLPHLWETVVTTQIAEKHGFVAPTPKAVALSDWPAVDVPSAGVSPVVVQDTPPKELTPATGKGGRSRSKSATDTSSAGAPEATKASGSKRGADEARAEETGEDSEDELPVIESLPPDSDSDVGITDDDIRLT